MSFIYILTLKTAEITDVKSAQVTTKKWKSLRQNLPHLVQKIANVVVNKLI